MIRRVPFLLLLALCGTGAPAQTFTIMGSKPIADRPVQLVATSAGKPVLVVAFNKNRPVAVVDDTRKTVSRESVSLRATWERLPGLISITLRTQFDNLTSDLGTPAGANKSLDAELVADSDLEDVFAAVVSYETMDNVLVGDTDVAVAGMEIGRLEKGQAKAVNLPIPHLSRSYSDSPLAGGVPYVRRWSLLIFSKGKQIRTSLGSAASDIILELYDERQIQALHAERIKGHFGLKLFRSRPLQFPDPIKQRHTGHTYRAKVNVSPQGRVETVQIDGCDDAELQQSVFDQLKIWRFLPPCQNGTYGPGAAEIPIKF